MVERYRDVAQRRVAADDGEAENGGECEDLEELSFGVDVLERDDFEEVDRGVAVGGAGDHVEHGKEDRVPVAVEAEEVLVEEEDSNVGTVPRRYDQSRRHHRREVGSACVGVVVPYVARRSRRNVEDLVVRRRVESRVAHSPRHPCLCLHHCRKDKMVMKLPTLPFPLCEREKEGVVA